jgi:hypothetical protein
MSAFGLGERRFHKMYQMVNFAKEATAKEGDNPFGYRPWLMGQIE